MSTISFDVFDTESIDKAVDSLRRLVDEDLPVAITEMLKEVSLSMANDMVQDVHIGRKHMQPKWDKHEPGRLLKSIHVENPGELHFQVIADAVDNRGEGYAKKEQTYSPGDHDFTKNALQNASSYIDAQKGWFSAL